MTRLMIPPSDNPELADTILELFDDICKSLNITWFLHAGVALGLVREGTYLPKDNDIDVGVYCDEEQSLALEDALIDAGFVMDDLLGGIVKAHFWYENMLLDVRGIGGEFGGERLVTDCILPYTKLFDHIEYNGRQYNIPHPYNEYFTCCYGPNWRIPKPKVSTAIFAPVCAEILHIGHINWLQEATNHGDYLIVGLCTDDFVERYKGHRPIIPYDQRKHILQALRCVDFVEPFRAFNDYEAIEKHNIKIYIVDNEFPKYAGEAKARKELQDRGIKYVTIARTPNISTSKIKEMCCDSLLSGGPDGHHGWWHRFYKQYRKR